MSHGDSEQPGYVYALDGDPTGGAYGPPRFDRYNTDAVGTVAYPDGWVVPIVAGSPASRVPLRFRPAGEIREPVTRRDHGGNRFRFKEDFFDIAVVNFGS